MTRVVRLFAVSLLAGLALILVAGEAWAENRRWSYYGSYTVTYEQLLNESASALSVHKSEDNLTGWIEFECKPGDLVSKFRAKVSATIIDMESLDRFPNQNVYPPGDHKVFWTVDKSAQQDSVWKPNLEIGGLILVGRQAFDLALDILRAQEQVKIETPRGVIVNDLVDARNTIIRLLKHCNRI